MNNITQICGNKCWCSRCGQPIFKGELFIYYERSGYQSHSRFNLCLNCIKKAHNEIPRKMRNEKIKKLIVVSLEEEKE